MYKGGVHQNHVSFNSLSHHTIIINISLLIVRGHICSRSSIKYIATAQHSLAQEKEERRQETLNYISFSVFSTPICLRRREPFTTSLTIWRAIKLYLCCCGWWYSVCVSTLVSCTLYPWKAPLCIKLILSLFCSLRRRLSRPFNLYLHLHSPAYDNHLLQLVTSLIIIIIVVLL